MPLPITLDLFTDLSGFVRDWLPVIAAIVGFVAVMVYLIAYLSRRFEVIRVVLETQESRYLDVGTLDFIRRVIEWFWIGILVIVIVGIASTRLPEARSLLEAFIVRFPAIVIVIFTLFVAVVFIRALRRFGLYLRGEMRTKPQRLAQPRLWSVTELILKYFTIGAAILVAFVGAYDALPDSVPEKAFLLGVRQSLEGSSAQLFNGVLVAVVGALFAFGVARFTNSLFDDMKQRAKRHGPLLLDQFKGLTRTAVYLLSFTTILFVELDLFLSAEHLMAFAISVVLAVVFVLLISFESLRNAFAGIALMTADPFSVGDRVKIGEDHVGEVTGITLTMTQLRTGRGELVTLPNRQVLSTAVLNFTRSEHHPIFVDVAVGWEVSHRTVEQILLEAARRTPGVLEAPPPQVFGKDVTGNSIVHQLLAFTNDPERMKQVKSALVYTVQDLFHENNLQALASSR